MAIASAQETFRTLSQNSSSILSNLHKTGTRIAALIPQGGHNGLVPESSRELRGLSGPQSPAVIGVITNSS